MIETSVNPAIASLLERYKTCRAMSLQLAAPLGLEDYIPQPVNFASPPKWHLAHITWFFEEFILSKYLEGYKVFNTGYAFLFNSYYNTIGERTFRADRGAITRPTVKEVMAYRTHVDQHMTHLISSRGAESGLIEVLEIGINHEEQHQELFMTDLKHTFSMNPTWPIYMESSNLVSQHNDESGWLQCAAGIYEIGYQGEGFCFDNEFGRHKVYLQDYEISKSLVTNGEYLAFMDSGGYQSFEHWLDEGWSWVQGNAINSPLYWHKIDGQWHYYTLSGLQVLDEGAILSHVSYYEADAFARWKGLRLPTEQEWEAASPKLDWGKRWEWTASSYLPYPGFKTAPGALGEYNGKFMVNQMVLRGSSPVTAANHSRDTYRNFFHPQYQWQFSGIRLAK
jgi:ergothioneine biosynthesis protein EgtB